MNRCSARPRVLIRVVAGVASTIEGVGHGAAAPQCRSALREIYPATSIPPTSLHGGNGQDTTLGRGPV